MASACLFFPFLGESSHSRGCSCVIGPKSPCGRLSSSREELSRTNARMGRVDRDWTKSGGRPFSHWPGVLLVVGELAQGPHYVVPGKMPFRVAISTEPDPQGTGPVDIHAHPYTTIACAAGVVTRTTDRVSSRYHCSGIRRVRQLALGFAKAIELNRHTTRMKTRGSVVN